MLRALASPSAARSAVRPALTRDALARATALAAAAAALAVAPFEQLDPVLVLPGQSLTNVEVVLAAGFAAWLLARAATRDRFWRQPLARPLVLVLGALLLASILAPDDRAHAFKTTGRFAAGAMVALVAADAASTPARAAVVLGAGVASATVVAVVAGLEARQEPEVLRWLTRFRPGIHVAGGDIRAGGTLQYPTIASMYLELAFAFGLGLLAFAVGRRWTRTAAALFVASSLVAEAIALTLTRAGLLALGLALGTVLAGLVRRHGWDARARAVTVLGLVVAVLVTVTWSARGSWLRLTTESTAGWYLAEYAVPPALAMRPGETRRVDVRVRNAGRITWRSRTDDPFGLSYHWLASGGDDVVEFDGLRTEFPHPVPPGAWASVAAWVRAPAHPGRYRLAWDVVQEHRLWFSTEGAPLAFTEVEVAGAPSTTAPPVLRGAAFPPPKTPVGRLALWRAALAMLAERPLTGVGPDNFRFRYGPYAGVARPDPRLHSNNMYLEILAGAGLVGGLAWVGLLWPIGRRLFAATCASADAGLALRLGIGAALIVTLAHGLVDSFFTFTPTSVAIWTAIGLAARAGAPAGEWSHADRA
jgi:hypothetical protein